MKRLLKTGACALAIYCGAFSANAFANDISFYGGRDLTDPGATTLSISGGYDIRPRPGIELRADLAYSFGGTDGTIPFFDGMGNQNTTSIEIDRNVISLLIGPGWRSGERFGAVEIGIAGQVGVGFGFHF